ncbi:MAG: ABC transporter ATP-binding protein [Sandaracinaceae bacterium]|nr:ABC transporter ATP-binding protein [Sandaracinaceae bacterium]
MEFDRVEVQGLVKVYGATRALIGVDASFAAKRVTVVEGPNGSGKSTLLNILGQLVRPTRGKVRYGDENVDRGSDLRAAIGILAHAAMIYPDLSALENLALYAQLYELTKPAEAIAELVDRFEIGRWGERPARTYSRGQLQRLALGRALMHRPQLLLLDEPSTGLDVRGVERLVTTVESERARGAIVVLITHDPKLAERLADDRIALDRGKVVSP